MSPSNLCPQGSVNTAENKIERLEEPVRMVNIKESRMPKQSRTNTHTHAQTLWQHRQGLHRSVPDGVSALRER